MPKLVTENRPLSEVESKNGHMVIQAITAGWGSSGYYSPAVVEAAAPLFKAGTHMYLDHPSESEKVDRPARSVRDIAAVLTEDGHWDAERQAVVAEAKPMAPYKELLTDLAEVVGLSIRGSATDIVEGEAEGRRGGIIEGLAHIDSVDFVTAAGRGGKVLQLLESARTNARALDRGVAEATVNDKREALSTVVKDAYSADKVYVWLRDFDDATAWFEVESGDDSGVYQQTYASDADGVATALTGARVEVRQVTQYVPVIPAGQSTTEESEEDTMAGTEIEEANRRADEANSRATVLEAERDAEKQRADAAERQVAEADARKDADKRARTKVRESNATLAAPIVDRIVAEALREVPLTDDRKLDEAAFDKRVEAARTAEESYLAGLAESAGVGTITGFGPSDTSSEVSETDIDKAVANAFGRQVKEA